MKKLIVLITFTIMFFYSFAQKKHIYNNKNIIISGIVETIDLIDESCYYICKLKNVKVIYGNFKEETVTIKINSCATGFWRLKENEYVIISAKLIDNTYYTDKEYYDFSPFYSVLRIENSNKELFMIGLFRIKNPDLFIDSFTKYFNQIKIFNVINKRKTILKYISDKRETFLLRQFAISNLKTLYTKDCLSYPYIESIWVSLYNDTTLENDIRKKAISMIGGWNKEASIKIEPISLKNIDNYFIPYWKSGIKFCDSMINKYETIINGYPVINDTISLSKRDNLFFSGKIKKASKNKLTIKNLKIFEGKYSEDEITLRTDIDTTFNKEITGKNVLINTTLNNNKYILELNTKNKGFCMPPLTPDGNSMFIIDETNLKINNIKIKPNEFLKVITDYYLILNSHIKNKEKELIKNIVKGKYLFLRQRSLWEFSNLSLQYDSVYWDYNKKYNFLDSLSKQFGKYKAPPLTVITTADLLLTKSFNQNYSSKYNTNVYEFDYHKNSNQLQRLEGLLNSKNNFAQQYAVMRFQDLIKYYANLKKILNSRIKKFDN